MSFRLPEQIQLGIIFSKVCMSKEIIQLFYEGIESKCTIINSMPSCNYDQEMFVVKHVLELKSEVKKYIIVVRKLCIGDIVDFIDYSEK